MTSDCVIRVRGSVHSRQSADLTSTGAWRFPICSWDRWSGYSDLQLEWLRSSGPVGLRSKEVRQRVSPVPGWMCLLRRLASLLPCSSKMTTSSLAIQPCEDMSGQSSPSASNNSTSSYLSSSHRRRISSQDCASTQRSKVFRSTRSAASVSTRSKSRRHSDSIVP